MLVGWRRRRLESLGAMAVAWAVGRRAALQLRHKDVPCKVEVRLMVWLLGWEHLMLLGGVYGGR
jgi:hypothetical protein